MPSAKEYIAKLDKKFADEEGGWRKKMLGMYSQGASDREVMVDLGLTQKVWATLEQDTLDSDFAELVDYGDLLCRAWWEKQGRMMLKDKDFNVALWRINMANRFGWSEKTEQSLTRVDFSNADEAKLTREIEELHKKFEAGRGKG